MGKGNRARLRKAQEDANKQSVFNKNTKKQTPTWVWTVVTLFIVLLLVACVALSVVYEGGYIMRWTKVVESDNYSVNAAMISYYFYGYYNNIVSQAGDYLSYLGIDRYSSLKNQNFDETTTWFEYFMDMALDEAEKLCVYNEEARARGIKLDDEDNEAIEEVIQSIRDAAKENGYSLNGYVSLLYGTGVKIGDVRSALEMTQMASKCSDIISQEIEDAVTDGNIDDYYNEHSTDFWAADLLYYVFELDKDSDDYEAEKAKIDEYVAALLEVKDDESFKQYIAEMKADTHFDTLYLEHAEEYEDNLLPDEADLAEYKMSIIAGAVTNALAGNEFTETESEDVIEIMFSDIEAELTEYLVGIIDDLTLNDLAFVSAPEDGEDEDEAGLWASDSARAAGDMTSVDTSDEEKYVITVYRMINPMHRNDELARNVGHILFTKDKYESDEKALEKAEEILAQYKSGAMTREAFEALGDEYTADSSVFYDEVTRGMMVVEFEDWLFDADRKVGDTDIVQSEYGYHIMYFDGETDIPSWRIFVKNSIISNNSEAWYNDAVAGYHVTVNADAANKVNA